MSIGRRQLHRLSTAAIGAVLTFTVAGCGGGSHTSTSTGSPPSTPGKAIALAYKFANCMRSHGVSGFPDPQVSSNGTGTKIALHVTPSLINSPAFKSAQQACRRILPTESPQQRQAQLQARRSGLVSFAACMRSHGFSRFPDPTTQGQLTLAMVTAAGIDLHAPATRAAGLACVPASHGQLTRAAVEQATSPGAQTAQQQSGGG